MIRKLLCTFGHHDEEIKGLEFLAMPKRGPFDPSTDAQRGNTLYEWVCIHCGRTRKEWGEQL